MSYAVYQHGYSIVGTGDTAQGAIDNAEVDGDVTQLLEHLYGIRVFGQFYLVPITLKLYNLVSDGFTEAYQELEDRTLGTEEEYNDEHVR